MIYDLSYANKGVKIKDLPNKEYLIIRLGINDHQDTEFDNYLQQIGSIGVPFGLYWFTYASSIENAETECKVIRNIFNKNKDKYVFFKNLFQLPLFIDYEAEGKYNAHIQPKAFGQTAPVFKNMLSDIAQVGLYLNTGLLNQYLPSPDVSFEAKNMCTKNLWWADWTNRTSCPTGNYYIRQTGAGMYNGFKIDENVKGKDFRTYLNIDTPKWKNIKQIDVDGKYRIIVQKKENK